MFPIKETAEGLNRTFLGLLQAVAYAMSFGCPITFWAGSRAVENVDGFETLIKGQSLCIL
jgi:hypothetical protein